MAMCVCVCMSMSCKLASEIILKINQMRVRNGHFARKLKLAISENHLKAARNEIPWK